MSGINASVDEWKDKWVDGWMDACIVGGWINGRIGGQMDGWWTVTQMYKGMIKQVGRNE